MGWQLEVLEGVAATATEIGSGVYNVLSSTPLNQFLVDNATLEALTQIAGTEISPLVNDIGETIGYIGKSVASSNGSTAVSSTWMTITRTAETVTQELIDAAIPLVNGGTTADLQVGQEITKAGLTASAGVGGVAGTGVGTTALATVAGPSIAVALGVAAGTALYNIAPEFWTNVSDTLISAGKTIGGKIVSFFNPDGTEYYDTETVQIVQEALINGGYLGDGEISTLQADSYTPIESAPLNYVYTYPVTLTQLPVIPPSIFSGINNRYETFIELYATSQVYCTTERGYTCSFFSDAPFTLIFRTVDHVTQQDTTSFTINSSYNSEYNVNVGIRGWDRLFNYLVNIGISITSVTTPTGTGNIYGERFTSDLIKIFYNNWIRYFCIWYCSISYSIRFFSC